MPWRPWEVASPRWSSWKQRSPQQQWLWANRADITGYGTVTKSLCPRGPGSEDTHTRLLAGSVTSSQHRVRLTSLTPDEVNRAGDTRETHREGPWGPETEPHHSLHDHPDSAGEWLPPGCSLAPLPPQHPRRLQTQHGASAPPLQPSPGATLLGAGGGQQRAGLARDPSAPSPGDTRGPQFGEILARSRERLPTTT